jgi:hypothetical protein
MPEYSLPGYDAWKTATPPEYEEDEPEREEEPPICEVCGKPIPLADVRAYRAEAGDSTSEPACCDDCAEDECRP